MNSPIVGDELGVLSTFAVVADERSFTKAAVKLGVSRSAVIWSRAASTPAFRCPPFDGYFLYYPSRRHQPPALQALVDALRV